MPAKRHWTPHEDRRIAAARMLCRSWDAIGADLAASRSAVIERARLLAIPPMPRRGGVAPDEAGREPLPAGHPRAWAVLTAGTLLAAHPFSRDTFTPDRFTPAPCDTEA